MPELAEVEYYRKQWNCGLGHPITSIRVHGKKRIFRSVSVFQLVASLPGSVLWSSKAHGKRMLFRFSNHLWLGLHLGMTGKLRVEAPGFNPAKHDHLVLCQKSRTLVFSDPRLFGRVFFHQGRSKPDWWSNLPPSLISDEFTPNRMHAFLIRHRKLPIKAALLRQDGFPGIGNWMADEILWRAEIDPRTLCLAMPPAQLTTLWKTIRSVCQGAMKFISHDFSDPPPDWFFHERWHNGGKCPSDGAALNRETIGGRTTVWCPKCQRKTRVRKEIPS